MTIEIFTDGSGTLVDGPACIGVAIFEDGVLVEEQGAYVCEGTNNVAELRAIRRGLYLSGERFGFMQPVTVFTDSEYAIGSLTKDWDSQANAKLIAAIRDQIKGFAIVRFQHVDGHAGVFGNELADFLAGAARVTHFAGQGITKPPKRRPEPEAGALERERSGLVRVAPVVRNRKAVRS